jgi:anti-anti-sigma regulatory factor
VLWAAGRIDGADVQRWESALQVVAMLGPGPILIDLAGLASWSTSAQYAVLRAAERAVASGRQVVLCGATSGLRANTQLPVFDRLTAYPDSATVVAARLDLAIRWEVDRRRDDPPGQGRHPARGG